MQRRLPTSPRRRAARIAGVGATLAALTATLAFGPASVAQAQTTGASSGGDSWSLLPGTRRGYVGLNVGRPDYDLDCGTGLYDCDDPNARLYLYTGGLFNDWFGAELGYVNEGKAERGGGDARAQGLNLALVARAPVGPFNAFAKVGALYGRTKVEGTELLSGVESGSESGWGRSLAVGVGYDFTPNSGVVLEWSRNRYRFAGDARADVDATSIGYVHRF